MTVTMFYIKQDIVDRWSIVSFSYENNCGIELITKQRHIVCICSVTGISLSTIMSNPRLNYFRQTWRRTRGLSLGKEEKRKLC